jgi:hypothetical protein
MKIVGAVIQWLVLKTRWHSILITNYEACPESKFRLAVHGQKDNILNISLFLQVYMLLATSRHNRHTN